MENALFYMAFTLAGKTIDKLPLMNTQFCFVHFFISVTNLTRFFILLFIPALGANGMTIPQQTDHEEESMPLPFPSDRLGTGKQKLKKEMVYGGRCGTTYYYIYDYEYPWTPHAIRLVLRTNKGRLIKRMDLDDEPFTGAPECDHHVVRGVRTMEFSFGGGGSGFRFTNVIVRSNPTGHLLTYTITGHAENTMWQFKDLDGDGQKELILNDDALSFALCSSCNYDAKPVQYILCYEANTFRECTAKFPDHIHSVIESGFAMLKMRHEKHHRFAWSLFILFHATEIGEVEAAWIRLRASLPADMYEKVWNKRDRIALALKTRDERWTTR